MSTDVRAFPVPSELSLVPYSSGRRVTMQGSIRFPIHCSASVSWARHRADLIAAHTSPTCAPGLGDTTQGGIEIDRDPAVPGGSRDVVTGRASRRIVFKSASSLETNGHCCRFEVTDTQVAHLIIELSLEPDPAQVLASPVVPDQLPVRARPQVH